MYVSASYVQTCPATKFIIDYETEVPPIPQKNTKIMPDTSSQDTARPQADPSLSSHNVQEQFVHINIKQQRRPEEWRIDKTEPVFAV